MNPIENHMVSEPQERESPDRTITEHRFNVMTRTIRECIYRRLIRDGHEFDEAMEVFLEQIDLWLSKCSSDYILHCYETMGGNINDISLWPDRGVPHAN